MDVRDFDFDLPPDLIAQEPPAERGASRLLALDRASGRVTHSSVADLPELLTAGDLLVVNNTRVFPARLLGRRTPSGGSVEIAPQPDRPVRCARDRRLAPALRLRIPPRPFRLG